MRPPFALLLLALLKLIVRKRHEIREVAERLLPRRQICRRRIVVVPRPLSDPPLCGILL